VVEVRLIVVYNGEILCVGDWEEITLAVTLKKTSDELKHLPLVELTFEIFNTTREPYYFRDLMSEIQALRGMTDEQVMDVMARLYTEINIDGRFMCIGQNVWGLKRWYPVDKVAEKAVTGKRFVRRTGDAFSDDDEIDDEFEDEELAELEVEELESPIKIFHDDDDDDSDESEDDALPVTEGEDEVFDEEDSEETELDGDAAITDDDDDDDEDDDEN